MFLESRDQGHLIGAMTNVGTKVDELSGAQLQKRRNLLLEKPPTVEGPPPSPPAPAFQLLASAIG